MAAIAAHELLSELADVGGSFALFGAIDVGTDREPAYLSPTAVVDPGSLPPDLKVDVALVRPSSGEAERDIGMLLARLRDVHATRVIVLPDLLGTAGVTGFVALGFEPKKSPSFDGLLYVWDPALADQPREWNNARNWANPENFSKYRW